MPANTDELFYRDEADAVIYLPQGLEKNFYNGESAPVGIFYDNSNTAQGDFDLIVMGNRGFGGFDSETLGTVAKFVQDNSTKPVIFAKGMPGDWDDDNNFVGGENKWK